MFRDVQGFGGARLPKRIKGFGFRVRPRTLHLTRAGITEDIPLSWFAISLCSSQ